MRLSCCFRFDTWRRQALALVCAALPAVPAVADDPAAESMQALAARYAESMQAGLHDEAASLAAGYISLLLKQAEPNRRDWAEALIWLADAQQAAQDNEGALQNYQHSIDVLQSLAGRLDAALIAPLTGAGDALFELERFDEAAAHYQRVLHLQQVNLGLHDMAQGSILERLSETHLRAGDAEGALAWRRAVTGLYRQNYPGDDIRKLQPLLAEAGLLRTVGLHVDSHTVYRRTINMVERAESASTPAILPALILIADLLANHSIKDGYDGRPLARRYMQRALHIAETNPEVTPLEKADTYIAMGDFYSTQSFDFRAVRRYYRAAYEALAAEPGLQADLDERFGDAVLLNELPPTTAPDLRKLFVRLSSEEPRPGARILLRFDVDEDGRAQNIEVLEGDTGGYWSRLAVEHAEKFIFRPRYRDGHPVRHDDMHWAIPYIADADDLSG